MAFGRSGVDNAGLDVSSSQARPIGIVGALGKGYIRRHGIQEDQGWLGRQ